MTSSTFDPERHAALLTVSISALAAWWCALVAHDRIVQLLVDIYITSGTPVKIAEGFLAVFTTGYAALPRLAPA